MNIKPDIKDAVPEAAPPARDLSALVHQDWASPKLLDFVRRAAAVSDASLRLENKIAFVGSNEMLADLAAFASVEPIPPNEIEQQAEKPADIFLIEGRWPRLENGWRKGLLNLPGGDAGKLRQLVEHYRARGTPTVLWITDEAESAHAYAHLYDIVDAIFVPSEWALTDPKMVHLDAGVNVRVFHPFKPNVHKFKNESGYFRFAIDGAYELSQHLEGGAALELIRPLLAYNTWLVDSSYQLRNNNEKVPAVLRRRFMGCIDEPALAFLLRNSWGIFYPSVVTGRRPAFFRKRALQAAACKSLVFTDAATPKGPGIVNVGSAEEWASALDFIKKDMVGLLGLQHLAWRDAVTNQTYFERLETIFAKVNVKPLYNENPLPSINIVVPTIRPQLIPFVLEMYALQTYKNIQLTIVANGVTVPDEIARQVAAAPNAKLCYVPSDKSIGYCMNFGIDQAATDYWAKWDDDDIYGPHFLEDLILQRKYLDFEISGKGSIFTYLEERGCLHVRRLDNRDTVQEFVGGGTLLVKNPDRYFPEDVRGFADTMFLVNAAKRADRIVAGDPFNFIQVRRADPTSHTWTAGSHSLNLVGPARDGLRFDHVIL